MNRREAEAGEKRISEFKMGIREKEAEASLGGEEEERGGDDDLHLLT